mmetsp:Transcript_33097/g.75452  ORF Transcript_33097/g.75452 Transcript_33097/m.75452 type:complete len:214 (+) Transcript_33097:888-1529(+)
MTLALLPVIVRARLTWQVFVWRRARGATIEQEVSCDLQPFLLRSAPVNGVRSNVDKLTQVWSRLPSSVCIARWMLLLNFYFRASATSLRVECQGASGCFKVRVPNPLQQLCVGEACIAMFQDQVVCRPQGGIDGIKEQMRQDWIIFRLLVEHPRLVLHLLNDPRLHLISAIFQGCNIIVPCLPFGSEAVDINRQHSIIATFIRVWAVRRKEEH